MGKIKKILEKELGSTQSVEVYPVTSIEAVYDENNERLDNIINRKNKEIQKELEVEVARATNAESNLRETINNITEINENATSANIVTIDTIPNTSSSNVQQALNELFKNATFAGIATPTTNPGTPDGPVFYIATTAGNYSNFSNIEISKGESAILKWNNNIWIKNIFQTVAVYSYESDGDNVDLDVSDENGNVILRLKNGHLYVQKFRSDNTLSIENLQIRTELSDDETGNRELRLFLVGYNSEGEPQEYGPYSLPYATEESEGTMSAEDKRHLERLDTTDGEESDLDVSDPDGNMIARFKNGHIQTQKFNSEVDGQTSVVNGEDADFDISDENDNVIARFSGGHIKTQKFDSMKTPAQIDDNGTAEFQIADEFGNIIAEFKEGNFRTKNFDSTKSTGSSAKVVKDDQDRNILILSRSAVINGKLYL